jgi:hypothetical protein
MAHTSARLRPEHSHHAATRLRQRGISAAVVNLILNHHDRVIPVGDGCCALSVSAAETEQLRAEGIAPSILEKAVGVVLIENDRQRLVTGLRAHGAARHRYVHRT